MWQLPQHLLALALRLYYKGIDINNPVAIRLSDKMKGELSLGQYMFLPMEQGASIHLAHGLGHTKQSRLLGPLYLLVIGLPSSINALVNKDPEKYYKFYTEKWADKLANIKRDAVE